MPYRRDLPTRPHKVMALPLDERGFPIPWFVAELPDGTRDFRIANAEKRERAAKLDLCWVCGAKLGVHKCFVVGPMCVCTGTTSEPPCHLECAIYAAKACPFLTRPRMRRNDRGLDEIGATEAPGIVLSRNPGAAAVYITKSYSRFPADGGWLIKLGKAEKVFWYAEGREATRDEVQASITSGYPLLEDLARKDPDAPGALAMLAKQMQAVEPLLPK